MNIEYIFFFNWTMANWEIVNSTIERYFTQFIFCKIFWFSSKIKLIPRYVITQLRFLNLCFTHIQITFISIVMWTQTKLFISCSKVNSNFFMLYQRYQYYHQLVLYLIIKSSIISMRLWIIINTKNYNISRKVITTLHKPAIMDNSIFDCIS